ncbi:MAG: hypothetical protein II453_01325 [Alphaproteobacteria bacterium]|nr:hypothetical protein [Alphaproteobacteria bacterium]
MQNYVSSIDNKLKQSKLNNVILSLDCLVSCSTNDKTEQNYGVIEYSGPISPGQVIKGSKKPMKSGTPVIADNIFLGVINNDGDLTVSNNCQTKSSWSVDSKYQDITYDFTWLGTVSSCYQCTLTSCNTCCSTTTLDGWEVTCTCTTYCYNINEVCYFPTALMRSQYWQSPFSTDIWQSVDTYFRLNNDGSIYPYACFECDSPDDGYRWSRWCWPVVGCFCNGKTCYTCMPPNGTVARAEGDGWHYADPNVIYAPEYYAWCGQEAYTIHMTATHCCTVCTTLCRKVLDCVDFCMRYL